MILLLLSLSAQNVDATEATVPIDQAGLTEEVLATPDPGQMAYATCGGCHGAQGQGNLALNGTALAGQDASYTARQLRNYKAGLRGTDPGDIYGAQMRGMSNVLVDEAAIVAVSEYIAGLERAPAKGSEADLSAGKAAYATCVTCHGEQAQGNVVMNGPALAGLDAPYLERQLADYREGRRGAQAGDPWGASMVPLAKQLDAERSAAVAAYLASL